ncbi:MAG: TIGR00341 family protein [Candidatus Aminicenantes bacterium]|nr:TIGR00341 family protein [Candidatus Aminicenantes bacterium]
MALRSLRIIVPVEQKDAVLRLLEESGVTEKIHHYLTEGLWTLEVIVQAEQSEKVMDILEKRFGKSEGFRMILTSLEATVPRLETEPPGPETTRTGEPEPEKPPMRICREELYADIKDFSEPSWHFMVMVMLSALVAGIGLLRSNPAIVIGAMVIAPLLGPSVGMAFGTAVGDMALLRRAATTSLAGVLLTVACAFVWGVLSTVDPAIPEIASRTFVGVGDIVLALASGCAAVLSLSKGAASALVGVMIAVALLPPLVAFGLLAGSGHWQPALGAVLVFAANFVCVNLAGVLTFMYQGIQPLSWWEKASARRAVRRAICIWLGMLGLLLGIILLSAK